MRRVSNPSGMLLMPSLELGKPPIEFRELPVAPDDAWGVRCGGCKLWFARPRDVVDDMNVCRDCRGGIETGVLAVIPDDILLIEDAEAILERGWWHSSVSDSIDLGRTDIMHWGSRDAAIERAHVRLSVGAAPNDRMFLHRSSVRPAASVHAHVMLERPGEGTDHTHGESLLHSHDVVRYVNGTEGPGAVSLLLRPNSLEAVFLECVLEIELGVTAPASHK